MLTETEISKLQQFLDNEVLFQTIEKVFNQTIHEALPDITTLDYNQVIGEKYRAYDQSKTIVKEAFNKLLTYKQGREIKEELNLAR